MKTVRIILIAATILSYVGSSAQSGKKVADKTFKTLLDRYVAINPPINYKRIEIDSEKMTKDEAIHFFHKTEDNLIWTITEVGENDGVYTSQEEYVPGCIFKYQLNDSIYMLCTFAQSGITIEDSILEILYSFTNDGIMIDECVVGGTFAFGAKCASCVLFDKNHVRVFYYNDDYTKENEGYLSTVYYVNYEITGDGKFVKKDKSNIKYLKNYAIKYSTYKPKSDDPMNEYDF